MPQVESYLGRIVDKMRSELRGILADSVAAYPAKPRDDWLFDWPSQTILVGGVARMDCSSQTEELCFTPRQRGAVTLHA